MKTYLSMSAILYYDYVLTLGMSSLCSASSVVHLISTARSWGKISVEQKDPDFKQNSVLLEPLLSTHWDDNIKCLKFWGVFESNCKTIWVKTW